MAKIDFVEEIDFVEDKPENKKIDLTPSGLINNISGAAASAIMAPYTAIKEGVNPIEATKRNWGKVQEAQKTNPHPYTDAVTDLAGYMLLPQANLFKGAGLLAKVGNSALSGGYQGALTGGLESLKNKGDLSGAGSGAGIGTAIGVAIPPSMLGVKKTLDNPTVQKGIANTLEVLTSVPAKFSELALKAEKAGKSIFQGKFDPETAYRGVEKKLTAAKNALPKPETYKNQYKVLGQQVGQRLNENVKPDAYFDNQIYELGQQYLNNVKKIEEATGQKVTEELKNLPSDINFNSAELLDEVNKIFGQHSFSGNQTLNPAVNTSQRELETIKSLLQGADGKIAQRTPLELYDINQNISNMIRWDDLAAADKNNALQRVYGSFANRLSELSPYLEDANKTYGYLMDLKKATGGLNPSTIGQKLANYGNQNQILAGVDKALQNIDDMNIAQSQILPDVRRINSQKQAQLELQNNIPQSIRNDISKYSNAPIEVQDAIEQIAPNELTLYQRILGEENASKELLNTIGKQYERNPRLLANRTDEAFENALNDLQEKSNINFMDELNTVRAREALEKLAPGQGGGSGSEQGFWNNVMRPLIINAARTGGAAVTGSALGGPAGAILGVLSTSPKLMAQKTIRNLGGLYRNLPEVTNTMQRLLPPAAVMSTSPMLYGNVEYNDYR